MDETSRLQFFEGQMTLQEFASAVTGLGYQTIIADIRGLEYIGKEKVTESREAVYLGRCYDRENLEKWLVENAQEEGWILNASLGSQSSVSYNKDGNTVLCYSVTKYIEPTTKAL